MSDGLIVIQDINATTLYICTTTFDETVEKEVARLEKATMGTRVGAPLPPGRYVLKLDVVRRTLITPERQIVATPMVSEVRL